MEDNEIETEGITYLSNNLRYITNLIHLNISGNCIENDGVIELCNNFMYITKLQILQINSIITCIIGCSIGDIGMIKLSKSMSIIQQLTSLDVGLNSIVPISEYNTSYEYMKNIIEISIYGIIILISGMDVGDYGIIPFCKNWRFLPYLVNVNMGCIII